MNIEELKKIRNRYNLNRKSFAEKLEISKDTLDLWEYRNKEIPVDKIEYIQYVFSDYFKEPKDFQEIKKNEDPFQNLTIDKKLDKLYYLLNTCVVKISSMEDEIKKLINEKEQDKEKSIAKTKSKIEKEILKAESIKVDLKHGDAKP